MRTIWLAAVTALAATAAAQDRAKLLERQFARYDRNGDGAIEREEFPGSDRQFEAMDADGDGRVPFEEYADSPLARRFLRARYRNEGEPRPRTSAAELVHARMRRVDRFDEDGDGRVTASEWRGAPAAFRTLDLDGNGVIDRHDRAELRSRPDLREPPVPDIEELPPTEELMRLLDRDDDGLLEERELRRSPLGKAMRFADKDGNHALDARELRALRRALAERREQREQERRRPRAFRVPFAVWDENDDGRLEQDEWVERRYLFARIDLDRDAAVTEEEVERYRLSVEGRDFVERFDLDGNHRVTEAEFGGPPSAFLRADRNGDGVVTRHDR